MYESLGSMSSTEKKRDIWSLISVLPNLLPSNLMTFPRTWTKGGVPTSQCMLSGIHVLPHDTLLAFVYKAWHVHVCINREALISQLPNKGSFDFTIGNGGHIGPDPIWVHLSWSRWVPALMPQRCYRERWSSESSEESRADQTRN